MAENEGLISILQIVVTFPQTERHESKRMKAVPSGECNLFVGCCPKQPIATPPPLPLQVQNIWLLSNIQPVAVRRSKCKALHSVNGLVKW